MILSIVSGTFNRRAYLANMVESARRVLPAHFPYEFVIVDGGSTDGTLDWCKQQPDVRLIAQGELRGAIAAFCDGARAATGSYVILANDDITFEPDSIMPAIVHLETHPDDGAVAFQDNRPAPGYSDGYKVQGIAVSVDGQIDNYAYAQVGLFRRWLGDLCGWWGADDKIMGWRGSTYGGDNFLSARIYEHGYSLAVLDACKVNDHIAADGLRQRNDQTEKTNSCAYCKRYPRPPVFGSIDKPHNPQTERLRVLLLNLYEPGFGHYKRGLRDALERVGLVWEIDYVLSDYDLVSVVEQFQPHMLMMQLHSPDTVPLDVLARARQAQPGMVVINWNGDVYEEHLTSERMLAYLRHVDLQLTVNAATLPVYEARGINAAYWQVAYEPVDEAALPKARAHDVVFLANAYSDERKALGAALQAMKGVNVGLYGANWPFTAGNTTYNFAYGAALYRAATIAIGDNQYSKRGFVSNRLFEALAAGAFLLHQEVEGLDELLGLQDGVHYVAWTDTADLLDKVKYWLDGRRDSRRQGIAEAGRAYVREHHNFDRRVKELLTEIVPRIERVAV